MKRPLSQKLESATPQEVMPGFDVDAGWATLNSRLHKRISFSLRSWAVAASVALLLSFGAVWLYYISSQNTNTTLSLNNSNWSTQFSQSIPLPSNEEASVTVATRQSEIPDEIPTYFASGIHLNGNHNSFNRSQEFVCNGTSCPLEICIIQTIHCLDEQPRAVATCNVIEPDQARQLHFKAPEKQAVDCKVTVNEIRIRRVSTGETIVLNAETKPATAQELFNCLMGDANCELLAGLFNADCNNLDIPNYLKVENNFGNLTFY